MLLVSPSLFGATSLGAAFADAEATGSLDGPALLVDLSVEVVTLAAPSVVVAHVGSATNQETFQLGTTDGRNFSGRLTVAPRNQFVLIEALTPGGDAEISETVSLIDLGIDPVLLGLEPDLGAPLPSADRGLSSGTTETGESPSPLLPILLVAAALVALVMTIRVFRESAFSEPGSREED
jgi:hypothetical protein